MADMKGRSAFHQKLIKYSEELKVTPSTLTFDTATTLLERTEHAMSKCEYYHQNIIDVCVDENAIVVQEQAFDPIEKLYCAIKSSLRKVIRDFQVAAGASASSSTTAGTTVGSIHVKLPAIELPTFDGNYANWPSFKDLFVATVDSNPQLADSQKLQYLKTAVQNEPATLIKPITITNLHYKEAWEILVERYDNQREIVYSIINKLLSPKPLLSENVQDLQKLIDNSVECLRALKVLNLPIEHWDSFLVVVHLNKLDHNTRREWAIRQTGNTLPTWENFRVFINNHIRGLLATGTTSEKKVQSKDRTIRSYHTSTEATCVICKGSHPHYKCKELCSKPTPDRWKIVKKNRLCFNCLNTDHPVGECNSKNTCKKCGQNHHSLLHQDQRPPPNGNGNRVPAPQPRPPIVPDQQRQAPQLPNENPQQQVAQGPLRNAHLTVGSQVLLWTAIVRVKDAHGDTQLCRMFLDSGSEATFVTEQCIRRLGLRRQYSKITVNGISSTPVATTKGKVDLVLSGNNTSQCETLLVQAHIIPQVTADLPKFRCPAQDWKHLQGLTLADPEYHTPGPVDILLGGDYVAAIITTGKKTGPTHAPIAQNTLFGWVLSGRVDIAPPSTTTSFHLTLELDYIVRRFWEIEEAPKVRVLTAEEKQCEVHFNQTHTRGQDGRFMVAVPFNERKKELGLSRDIAIRRLHQVERRLKRQPQHHQKYVEFMNEYKRLGHMEKVLPHEARDVLGSTNYLPHHFVTNDHSSTTKLRVVFDGSAKSSTGVSLNDTLMVGATLQDDLFDLLLRFRLNPIVLKADITKMFRQFKLRPGDADYHRIVWRDSPNDPVEDYRLLTVTYGTACAPYLSTRCLQQLGEDCSESHPNAASTLKNDAYVDDLLTGESTTSRAIALYNELTEAVASAGMELRK